MDAKRISKWLGSTEGLGNGVVALLGVIATIWAATSQILQPWLEFMPAWVASAAPVIVVAVLGGLLWRSYRRFHRASRVEDPDAFTLRPTTPESLIGRDRELAGLLDSVKRNRLVLLDGESGCGKSALVSAGLIPQLHASGDLLPVLIQDWGDDWERGPLAAALDSLHHSVSSEDRIRLGWSASPDLTAQAQGLFDQLDARLGAIATTLRRRPLIIADQFDDYQGRHGKRFVAEDGELLTSSRLAASNAFWRLMSSRLRDGHLHLLVINRSDTAAGRDCIRFVGEEQTATRTLPRVDADYLRPLLAGIAPENAGRTVVSNPANGWSDLQDQLDRDLRAEGAILMQQVRTVLLGVRQLELLTPRHYQRAGGLRGMETLAISRALRRAVEGSGVTIEQARAVLAALIRPGGPKQPPKAERASLDHLSTLAGTKARAEAIVTTLRNSGVVRLAETAGGETWQLDHDYLARAVLAEARHADRWSIALNEGRARYEQARGNWRQRWKSLLPFASLVRLCWERLRGRVRFGAAGAYVRASVARPAAVFAAVAAGWLALHAFSSDDRLTARAAEIVDALGTADEAESSATLQAWKAPPELREEIYRLIRTSDPRSYRALSSRWPLAFAGYDSERLQGVTRALRSRIQSIDANRFTSRDDHVHETYVSLVDRLSSRQKVKSEIVAMRGQLNMENKFISSNAFAAYTSISAHLLTQDDIRDELAMLRSAFERSGTTLEALEPYTVLALRLSESHDLKAVSQFLRQWIAERSRNTPDRIVRVYIAILARLNDVQEMRATAQTLHAWIRRGGASSNGVSSDLLENYLFAVRYLQASDPTHHQSANVRNVMQETAFNGSDHAWKTYGEIVSGMRTADTVRDEVVSWRTKLIEPPNPGEVHRLLLGYTAAVRQMTNQSHLQAEAAAIRGKLAQLVSSGRDFGVYAVAYVALADGMHDSEVVNAEYAEIRRLDQFVELCESFDFARAYVAIAEKLVEPEDLRAVAAKFEVCMDKALRTNGSLIFFTLSEGYAAITSRMKEPEDWRNVSRKLLHMFESEPDLYLRDSPLPKVYADIITRVEEPGAAAQNLRERLQKAKGPRTVSNLSHAYASVLAHLSEPAALRRETTAALQLIENPPESSAVLPLARLYVDIFSRAPLVPDLGDSYRTLAILRQRVLDATSEVDSHAEVYALIARPLFQAGDRSARERLVREVLILSTHPLLRSPSHLLEVFEPARSGNVDPSAGAAFRWARETYGIEASQLWPASL